MPIDISFYKRWTFFHSQSTSSRREDFMATDMGTNQDTKANQLKKNCKKKVPKNPWSIVGRSWFPCPNGWKQSRWRSLSTMGCSCKWRSHSPPVRTRKLPLQEQMVVPSQKSGSDTRPVKKLSDFNQALSTLERLHQETGEKNIRAHLFV